MPAHEPSRLEPLRPEPPRLEQQLERRFPQLFSGRRAGLTRPLLRTLGRWSRFDEIGGFLARNGSRRNFEFITAALGFLQADYRVDPQALASIPASGRLLIVANHPSGALDALALLDAVGRVRRDVKIVANDVLSLLEPLSGLLLPVRVFGGRAGAESLRAIDQALAAEQCVIVFPAGEVSRLGLRGVRDSRWRQGFVRFARNSGAPVQPIRIVARNSALFYGASALYKPAATALLAREMFSRPGRRLELRIGPMLQLDPERENAQLLQEVRRALYALGRRRDTQSGPEPLPAPIAPAVLAEAVATTELLGSTGDGKEIRLARLAHGAELARDPLMRELGRLRELTFRAVGEGTGRARDLDAWDAHYDHILVWDAQATKIAGAYRVARGARVLARQGLSGLYTASLFRYADEALPRIAQGMELGRSFVAPEYWGSRSLDYLWQGIGAYLRRYPQVRYLYGAVSISAALPLPAREQLVAYYSHFYGAGRFHGADARSGAVATSLRPFRYFAAPPSFGDMDADTAFGVLKGNLSAHGASVPMLYKQYTELCEPGGARFLAFGVDPAFSDSIDGLIEIDLHTILPKKRQRYLLARDVERHGVREREVHEGDVHEGDVHETRTHGAAT